MLPESSKRLSLLCFYTKRFQTNLEKEYLATVGDIPLSLNGSLSIQSIFELANGKVFASSDVFIIPIHLSLKN